MNDHMEIGLTPPNQKHTNLDIKNGNIDIDPVKPNVVPQFKGLIAKPASIDTNCNGDIVNKDGPGNSLNMNLINNEKLQNNCKPITQIIGNKTYVVSLGKESHLMNTVNGSPSSSSLLMQQAALAAVVQQQQQMQQYILKHIGALNTMSQLKNLGAGHVNGNLMINNFANNGLNSCISPSYGMNLLNGFPTMPNNQHNITTDLKHSSSTINNTISRAEHNIIPAKRKLKKEEDKVVPTTTSTNKKLIQEKRESKKLKTKNGVFAVNTSLKTNVSNGSLTSNHVKNTSHNFTFPLNNDNKDSNCCPSPVVYGSEPKNIIIDSTKNFIEPSTTLILKSDSNSTNSESDRNFNLIRNNSDNSNNNNCRNCFTSYNNIKNNNNNVPPNKSFNSAIPINQMQLLNALFSSSPMDVNNLLTTLKTQTMLAGALAKSKQISQQVSPLQAMANLQKGVFNLSTRNSACSSLNIPYQNNAYNTAPLINNVRTTMHAEPIHSGSANTLTSKIGLQSTTASKEMDLPKVATTMPTTFATTLTSQSLPKIVFSVASILESNNIVAKNIKITHPQSINHTRSPTNNQSLGSKLVFVAPNSKSSSMPFQNLPDYNLKMAPKTTIIRASHSLSHFKPNLSLNANHKNQSISSSYADSSGICSYVISKPVPSIKCQSLPPPNPNSTSNFVLDPSNSHKLKAITPQLLPSSSQNIIGSGQNTKTALNKLTASISLSNLEIVSTVSPITNLTPQPGALITTPLYDSSHETRPHASSALIPPSLPSIATFVTNDHIPPTTVASQASYASPITTTSVPHATDLVTGNNFFEQSSTNTKRSPYYYPTFTANSHPMAIDTSLCGIGKLMSDLAGSPLPDDMSTRIIGSLSHIQPGNTPSRIEILTPSYDIVSNMNNNNNNTVTDTYITNLPLPASYSSSLPASASPMPSSSLTSSTFSISTANKPAITNLTTTSASPTKRTYTRNPNRAPRNSNKISVPTTARSIAASGTLNLNSINHKNNNHRSNNYNNCTTSYQRTTNIKPLTVLANLPGRNNNNNLMPAPQVPAVVTQYVLYSPGAPSNNYYASGQQHLSTNMGGAGAFPLGGTNFSALANNNMVTGNNNNSNNSLVALNQPNYPLNFIGYAAAPNNVSALGQLGAGTGGAPSFLLISGNFNQQPHFAAANFLANQLGNAFNSPSTFLYNNNNNNTNLLNHSLNSNNNNNNNVNNNMGNFHDPSGYNGYNPSVIPTPAPTVALPMPNLIVDNHGIATNNSKIVIRELVSPSATTSIDDVISPPHKEAINESMSQENYKCSTLMDSSTTTANKVSTSEKTGLGSNVQASDIVELDLPHPFIDECTVLPPYFEDRTSNCFARNSNALPNRFKPRFDEKEDLLIHFIEGHLIKESSFPLPLNKSFRSRIIEKAGYFSNLHENENLAEGIASATTTDNATKNLPLRVGTVENIQDQAISLSMAKDSPTTQKPNNSTILTNVNRTLNDTHLLTPKKSSHSLTIHTSPLNANFPSPSQSFTYNTNPKGSCLNSPTGFPGCAGSTGPLSVLNDTSSSVCSSPRYPIFPNLPPNLKDWNVEDVYQFVQSLPSCRDYAQTFRANEIDGHALCLLKEEHFIATLKMKLGPALKLQAKVAELVNQKGL